MFDLPLLQGLLLPFGLLFLFLHLGPALHVAKPASIHGGTRWWFFVLELVLFTGWLLGSPIVWESQLGRVVVIAHLSMHVGFALGAWFAPDRMLETAMIPRERSRFFWAASYTGLLFDTACHATVVALLVMALPLEQVLLMSLPAVLGYLFVTRIYLRRFHAEGAERGSGGLTWRA
jgi:hypothetical protein